MSEPSSQVEESKDQLVRTSDALVFQIDVAQIEPLQHSAVFQSLPQRNTHRTLVLIEVTTASM
jgi:hypothetical protein